MGNYGAHNSGTQVMGRPLQFQALIQNCGVPYGVPFLGSPRRLFGGEGMEGHVP